MPCHIIFHSIYARQRIVKLNYLLYNLYVGWRVCATVCLWRGSGRLVAVIVMKFCLFWINIVNFISWNRKSISFHYLFDWKRRQCGNSSLSLFRLFVHSIDYVSSESRTSRTKQNGTEHSLVSILSTRTWATQMREANTCGQNCYFHY